jgi:hypothetical protein
MLFKIIEKINDFAGAVAYFDARHFLKRPAKVRFLNVF